MGKINAIITGVGGYVPDYVLTNDELSRMVDTNDEWITTRVGIKERRILTEEGLGTSYYARLQVPFYCIYRYRQTGTEECLRVRLLGCLLRFPLLFGCSCHHDTERQIQEDYCNWSR